MNLLINLGKEHPIAHAMLILPLVAALGLGIGRVKLWNISIGIAGVLFAGLLFGHFGFAIDPSILEFARDFGLVLFVYTIGMQIGPGFFNSLQKKGLSLNLLAAATVVLGVILALELGRAFQLPVGVVAGLFCGATTNTPALGAAQETLKNLPGSNPASAALPALSYAAAYPFGIVGIILTMLFLRWFFGAHAGKKSTSLQIENEIPKGSLRRKSIFVDSPAYEGVRLGDIPLFQELSVIATRLFKNSDEVVHIATPDLRLHVGDLLLVVGEEENIKRLCSAIGRPAPIDVMEVTTDIQNRDLVVTHKNVIGQSLDELNLEHQHHVAISRVFRGDVEMTALPHIRLEFGDRLRVVGNKAHIAEVTAIVGDSPDALHHTHFIPVFIGIALGIVLGAIPFQIYGMPAPLSLGLAGGPLVVSILLSRLGRLGPLIWYMPLEANLALRELGIVLFLSCVGLKAGSHFVEILVHGDGLLWMLVASGITLLPLLAVGFAARYFFHEDFMTISGLLAGTMTDPPALAFANNITQSDAPSVSYATVYPLTMLLRILAAQAIVFLAH